MTKATYQALVARGLAKPHPAFFRYYLITKAGEDLAKRLPRNP